MHSNTGPDDAVTAGTEGYTPSLEQMKLARCTAPRPMRCDRGRSWRDDTTTAHVLQTLQELV